MFKQEEIELADKRIKTINDYNSFILNLSAKFFCNNCINKKDRQFVYPCGNPISNVMIVLPEPTKEEGEKHSFKDEEFKNLTILMHLLKIDISSYYVTGITKCNNSDCYKCASIYMDKEIRIVKPKVIILVGEAKLLTEFYGGSDIDVGKAYAKNFEDFKSNFIIVPSLKVSNIEEGKKITYFKNIWYLFSNIFRYYKNMLQ